MYIRTGQCDTCYKELDYPDQRFCNEECRKNYNECRNCGLNEIPENLWVVTSYSKNALLGNISIENWVFTSEAEANEWKKYIKSHHSTDWENEKVTVLKVGFDSHHSPICWKPY